VLRQVRGRGSGAMSPAEPQRRRDKSCSGVCSATRREKSVGSSVSCAAAAITDRGCVREQAAGSDHVNPVNPVEAQKSGARYSVVRRCSLVAWGVALGVDGWLFGRVTEGTEARRHKGTKRARRA